ncbi:response regulator transcription factor [Gracilibacillus oryzae]|uniref:Response regulator transcription factor n=1 Tax=Gracilibacillus oryzae TaxID=1672701 RepID=A0A7C8GSZ7_9BACI|nr:response regulator transcription factor [Gracilibacillus oryzae]KAB8129927.1 response regulator transcription factor [Gracilibacillus oryzae]
MQKVLIVDDERRTRQGLVSIINWEDYGFTVADTASNGFDALEKYSHIAPDLLIIDMKMPGMSGIELIEKIRKNDRSINILILSGHAEFEFAKKALKLNVTGYMLKPIEEEELISYLEQIQNKRQQQLSDQTDPQQQVEEHKQKLMDYLNSAHNKEAGTHTHDHLDWKSYRIILIKFHQASKNDINHIINSINNIFSEETMIAFLIKDYIGVLLSEQVNHFINNDIHFIEMDKIIQPLNIPYFMALSEEIDHYSELPNIYLMTLTLLQNSFFYKESKLLTKDSKKVIDDYLIKLDPQETFSSIKQRLCYFVEITDIRGIKETCWKIAKLMVNQNDTEQNIKNDFIKILSSCINHLTFHYPKEQSELLQKLTDIANLIHSRHLEQLVDQAVSILSETIQLLPLEEKEAIVKKMIILIERHFPQNIKLDTLADVLNYHRVYLGKLFKEYTGDYFNTYLDKVRIENSKQLILKGYKIYEVAEQVGYSNVDYFYSKFKKYVGMSPSVFKKNYSGDRLGHNKNS